MEKSLHLSQTGSIRLKLSIVERPDSSSVMCLENKNEPHYHRNDKVKIEVSEYDPGQGKIVYSIDEG
jgi:hypothetical protein